MAAVLAIVSRVVRLLAGLAAIASMLAAVATSRDCAAGTQLQATATSLALNAEEELDGSAAPAALEVQALGASATPLTSTYLAREYVWGPGDWGPDELLVQYDTARRASWPLQDAGGDVIALCDRGGANGTARVITQLVYDAYGTVIGRDDPATPSTGPPELRVGHKGLFFDRLDGGIADPFTGEELPRLEPGARLSGYARNRTLHCDLGRWNQRDPNATGMVVQARIGFGGWRTSLRVQTLEMSQHLADGAGLYVYARGVPWTKNDPAGLSVLVANFGAMGMSTDLNASHSGTTLSIAGNIWHSMVAYEQAGAGAFALGLAINGEWGDEVMGLLDDALGWEGVAFNANQPVTAEFLDRNMGPREHAKHGDTKKWKLVREKPGSGAPGHEKGPDGKPTGDVKYYEIWRDQFGTFVEVHFFRDAGGRLKDAGFSVRPLK